MGTHQLNKISLEIFGGSKWTGHHHHHPRCRRRSRRQFGEMGLVVVKFWGASWFFYIYERVHLSSCIWVEFYFHSAPPPPPHPRPHIHPFFLAKNGSTVRPSDDAFKQQFIQWNRILWWSFADGRAGQGGVDFSFLLPPHPTTPPRSSAEDEIAINCKNISHHRRRNSALENAQNWVRPTAQHPTLSS